MGATDEVMRARRVVQLSIEVGYFPPIYIFHSCGFGTSILTLRLKRYHYPQINVDTALMMSDRCPKCEDVVWYEFRSKQNDDAISA